MISEDKLRLLGDSLPIDMLVICDNYKEARKAFHAFADYVVFLSPHIEVKLQTMQVCFKDSTIRWIGFRQEWTLNDIRGCNYQRIFIETGDVSPYEKDQIGRRLRPHRLWVVDELGDLMEYIKEYYSI